MAGPYPGQVTAKTVEPIRYDQLDDMVAMLGSSVLGMTIGCARCHDHKYDPIAHRDYYAMIACLGKAVQQERGIDPDPAATKQKHDAWLATKAPVAAEADRFQREHLASRLAKWLAGDAAKQQAAPWQVLDPQSLKAAKATLLEEAGDAVAASGKLRAMRALLREVKRTTDDRFVLISNSTSILDLFDAVLSKERLRFMRLDGSLAANKRQERVDAFNTDPSIFAFRLSSKAGGCGINLIGANRLILFDPDWNPAIDAQALARVWRSGQQKPCYVYRLFAVRSLSPEPLRCCYHASPCT